MPNSTSNTTELPSNVTDASVGSDRQAGRSVSPATPQQKAKKKKRVSSRRPSRVVPLHRALARFIAFFREIDEVEAAANVSSCTKFAYNQSWLEFWLSSKFIFLACLFLIASTYSCLEWICKTRSFGAINGLLEASLVALALIAGTAIYRSVRNFGWGPPEEPLELPCLADFDEDVTELIEWFLSELRREGGATVYCFGSRLNGIRRRNGLVGIRGRSLNRRTFFGRYCYFLFSEHDHIRQAIPRYGSPFACQGELLISEADLQAIIERYKPRRKGNLGRISGGFFEAALMSLVPKLLQTSLGDEDRAISKIQSTLTSWYKDHSGEGGSVPKPEDVRRHAIGTYRGLLWLSSRKKEGS